MNFINYLLRLKPHQIGCDSTQIPNEWFTACKYGNMEEIKSLKQDNVNSRDSTAYSLTQSSFIDKSNISLSDSQSVHTLNDNFIRKYNISAPGFTGLLYGILYNQCLVVKELVEEMTTFVDQDIYIPSLSPSEFKKKSVQNTQVEHEFLENEIINFIELPANSTVLEICILLDRFACLTIIMEHLSSLPVPDQDMILQHINSLHETHFSLLAESINSNAVMHLVKYGQIIIESQNDFEEVLRENGVGFNDILKSVILQGNHELLEYFLSLCSNSEYFRLIEYVITNNEQNFTFFIEKNNLEKDDRYRKCIDMLKKFKNKEYPPPPRWLEVDETMIEENEIWRSIHMVEIEE